MTTTTTAEVPVLVRLARELDAAQQREREVGAEVQRAEAELPSAQHELVRVREELGAKMRAGTSAKDLRPLKTEEGQAALQVETTEAFVGGRRQALQNARRAVEKAKEALRMGNQKADAFRAQIRAQETRVGRGRQKIADDEASIAHRRTLLAGEERTLSALRGALRELVVADEVLVLGAALEEGRHAR